VVPDVILGWLEIVGQGGIRRACLVSEKILRISKKRLSARLSDANEQKTREEDREARSRRRSSD